MSNLADNLKHLVTGEVDNTDETREFYSHDASLFELKPEVVVFPKDVEDIKKVVSYVRTNKKSNPELSITGRSAGTDMSGGAINESIILDFTKHFDQIFGVTETQAHVQPGLHFRDFDKATIEKNALLPPYPASRDLCTVGGMVNNNSGGEKSLEYGKTEKYIEELKVVFADGNEYVVKPLDKAGLDAKIAQNDFEGNLYRQVFELVDGKYDEIKAAKPHVTKNSMGYNLWNIWDRETGVFDLTQLIVGSQGTLGMLTDITFRLVPRRPHSGMLVAFMKDTKQLGEVINVVLTQKPATFESFDDNTLWLSIKFFPFFRKTIGWQGLIQLGFRLIPDALMLLRGIPKLILMIEFTGETPEEVTAKVHKMKQVLAPYKMAMEEDDTEAKDKKFWIMRRESFNLLRKKVKDKHTAPFIDDLVVPPEHLPQFLPELRVIIKKYRLLATIAGHMGDGNFHIIPLMKIEEASERAKLEPAMREVNEIVLKYGGSLSGEHNDGMVRGPWLEQMYGPTIVGYFRDVKHIFDPENMFNPHKKSLADWDFSMKHVREHF